MVYVRYKRIGNADVAADLLKNRIIPKDYLLSALIFRLLILV